MAAYGRVNSILWSSATNPDSLPPLAAHGYQAPPSSSSPSPPSRPANNSLMNTPTLERRLRGDLIQTFQLLTGKENVNHNFFNHNTTNLRSQFEIKKITIMFGTHCLNLWYPHPLLISLKIGLTTNGICKRLICPLFVRLLPPKNLCINPKYIIS